MSAVRMTGSSAFDAVEWLDERTSVKTTASGKVRTILLKDRPRAHKWLLSSREVGFSSIEAEGVGAELRPLGHSALKFLMFHGPTSVMPTILELFAWWLEPTCQCGVKQSGRLDDLIKSQPK